MQHCSVSVVDAAGLQQCEWVTGILQDALRHVYQRGLLEAHGEVLELVEGVWGALLTALPPAYLVAAATPWLGVWICLLMQPPKLPYDTAYLIEAKHRVKVTMIINIVIIVIIIMKHL